MGASGYGQARVSVFISYTSPCPIGQVEDGTTGECRNPDPNKYTDLSGTEQDCDLTVPIANGVLGGQAVPFVTDRACPFACDTGLSEKRQRQNLCASGRLSQWLCERHHPEIVSRSRHGSLC